MKPFDLEAALNRAKVITIGGDMVTDLTKINSFYGQQILGGIISGKVHTWLLSGLSDDSRNNLFMADIDEAPKITKLEEFLEAYYPNYYSSELVARYNDLCVQLEGHETHANRGAFKEYKEIEDILFKGACDAYRLINLK